MFLVALLNVKLYTTISGVQSEHHFPSELSITLTVIITQCNPDWITTQNTGSSSLEPIMPITLAKLKLHCSQGLSFSCFHRVHRAACFATLITFTRLAPGSRGVLLLQLLHLLFLLLPLKPRVSIRPN